MNLDEHPTGQRFRDRDRPDRMGYAATLAEGESFTTVELKIQFLRAVRQGKLTAEARVVKAGSALGYVECDVTDQAGKLVARASSTCMKLRQDRPASTPSR